MSLVGQGQSRLTRGILLDKSHVEHEYLGDQGCNVLKSVQAIVVCGNAVIRGNEDTGQFDFAAPVCYKS